MQIADLPAVNAGLNLVATLLLLWGRVLIGQRREGAHRLVMLAAFGVSCLFLGCYLTYHYYAGHVKFAGPSPYREAYLLLLLTHVVLAALVPVLAITSIVLGLRGARGAHRRISRITYPVWMYVSVTGVLIYLILYKIWPPAAPVG